MELAIVAAVILGAWCAVAAVRARARWRALETRARLAQARARAWRASGALLALALASGAGACVPASALRLLEVEQAASAGHATDEGLPPEARDLATDHHDACAVLLELLDDRPLPPATRARIEARAAAAPVAS